jgi:hypothetical protein
MRLVYRKDEVLVIMSTVIMFHLHVFLGGRHVRTPPMKWSATVQVGE